MFYKTGLLFLFLMTAFSQLSANAHPPYLTDETLNVSDGGESNALPSPPDMLELVSLRERMVYSVHYGFLNLGSVIVERVQNIDYRGQPAYFFRTIIRSNPSIPFVGRKEVHYHSIFSFDEHTGFGLDFWTHSIHDNEFYTTRYTFDYQNQRVVYYELEEPVDTLALDKYGDAGPILVFLTRTYAGQDITVDYPIYVSQEIGIISMQFTSELQQIRSPAFGNNHIDVFASSGDARLKGPFGFSGFYRAWHKNNDSRIPVEAHVRVWLGNVKVRLQSYEKFE